MNRDDSLNQRLFAFLRSAPSPYHAVAALRARLDGEGYKLLPEGDFSALVPGGRYYVLRNGSSLIAFRIPKSTPYGFMFGAAHSDFPAPRIKAVPPVARGGGQTGLSVEGYGGMLCATWFDRPLSFAGRVAVRTETGLRTVLVNADRDLLLIPSVAIHFNREANKGTPCNMAVDMLPLFGEKTEGDAFLALLAGEAGCAPEDILSHDLYLYPRTPGTVFGREGEYIAAPHLDDGQCVFALTEGFLQAEEAASVPVLAVFDNEEVGSSTKQGADSTFLADTVAGIAGALGLSCAGMLASSFSVSADNAHAVHPNHPELSDPSMGPVLNGGVVLKHNASQRYATDALSGGLFEAFCRHGNVPVQHYANRADLPGGSTLGSISSTRVSVPTADVGLAQLAMHACYETAGARDTGALAEAMREVFGGALEKTADGYAIHYCSKK